MDGFEYLADGHHVDDAGNLIACTYVDFRGPGADGGSTIRRRRRFRTARIKDPRGCRTTTAKLCPGPGRDEAGHGWGALQRFAEPLPSTVVETLRGQGARVEAPIG